LDGDTLPVDLAANARSLGCRVIEVHDRPGLEEAVREARAAPADGGPVVIHVETDPLVHAPASASWSDVPVSEVGQLERTREAHAEYLRPTAPQRAHLTPVDDGSGHTHS